jgi:SulP family sulfate permease
MIELKFSKLENNFQLINRSQGLDVALNDSFDVWPIIEGLFDDNYDENTDLENINLKSVPRHKLVFEVTGPLFFGASDTLKGIVRDTAADIVILRMRSVQAIDATGIHSFESIIKTCRQKNITLIMSHVNNQPMKVLKQSGMYKDIGKENICENIDKALARAAEILK